MYIPKYFKIEDERMILDFMEKNSFGLLLSVSGDEVLNSQIPFLILKNNNDLFLQGHVARENDQFEKSKGKKVSALFLGPHHYISPSWYKSPSAVPTWDYAVVKATGIMEPLDDTDTLSQLRQLSKKFDPSWEALRKDKEQYYQKMMRELAAFKIKVDILEAKWKMSQNRPVEDLPEIMKQLRDFKENDADATADAILKVNKERLDRV